MAFSLRGLQRVLLRKDTCLFVCLSYNLDLEEKRDGLNWSDHKTLPLSEQGTLCVTGPNQVTVILLFPPRYVVVAIYLKVKAAAGRKFVCDRNTS